MNPVKWMTFENEVFAMACAKIVNSIGLMFDIIGIIILFVHDHKNEGKNIFETLPIGGEGPEIYRAKKRISRTGMVLIIVGFILQLISDWL